MTSDTRIRILWDTNVLVQALIFGQRDLLHYLDQLLLQQANEFIELVIPKSVQAEFYGVLRAGRLDITDENGVKHKEVQFAHADIVFLMEPYLGNLFDREFIDSLNDYDWPKGSYYKKVLLEIITKEYNWDDWGKSFIERKLAKSVEYMGLRDPYDYHVMAAALQFGVDLIVTANMDDFIDPLGKIRVMKAHDARVFDHFSLQVGPDDFNPPLL